MLRTLRSLCDRYVPIWPVARCGQVGRPGFASCGVRVGGATVACYESLAWVKVGRPKT